MKKLFLLLLLFSTESFASSGECHLQRNPMGFTNYNVCEVAGTDYVCVTLDKKENSSISCFLAKKESESSVKKETTRSQKLGNGPFDYDAQ